MTSKQQYNVLQKFREDKVNVLVATSVLEEGLDVPNCNLIIRFLYVKDEISRKQTGGRGSSKDTRHYALLYLFQLEGYSTQIPSLCISEQEVQGHRSWGVCMRSPIADIHIFCKIFSFLSSVSPWANPFP